jgi:hypothetical protein
MTSNVLACFTGFLYLFSQERRIVLKTKKKCYLLIDANRGAHVAMNGSGWISAGQKMRRQEVQSMNANDGYFLKMVVQIPGASLLQGLIACFYHYCR